MGVRVELYRNDNKVMIDAFDRLVINIFMEKEKHQNKSFLICGCDAGAGSTSIAIELAISLSVSGWKTILVDTDLRKESKYKRLNQKTKAGLSDYVNLNQTKEMIINSTNWKGLDYISCGNDNSETPVKILCSQKIRELQEELSKEYDFVIYDAPALNSAMDATIVAVGVDCTYLVVASEQTSFQNLTIAKEQLEGVEANLSGIIVNKVSEREYRRYVNDYNYFIQKEYVSRNKYYEKEKSRKKTWISKLKKWMGCFLFFCLLSCIPGETTVLAAKTSSTSSKTSSTVETAAMIPTIVVTEYEILEKSPAVGENFTLQVTVQNMNRYVAAHQVLLTLHMETEGMYLQQGETNQRYMEYLAPGETEVFKFQLATFEKIQRNAFQIDIEFDYVNEYGNIGTNTTSISPKLREHCKLEVLSVETAKDAMIDTKALFNIRYKNSGDVDIKNVKMRIEGNVETDGKEISLEALESGEQCYLDEYVIFTETGNQELQVYLTYEDEDGIAYEAEMQKVSTFVMENSLMKEEAEEDIKAVAVEEKQNQQILPVVCTIIAAMFLAMAALLKKRSDGNKKEKSK